MPLDFLQTCFTPIEHCMCTGLQNRCKNRMKEWVAERCTKAFFRASRCSGWSQWTSFGILPLICCCSHSPSSLLRAAKKQDRAPTPSLIFLLMENSPVVQTSKKSRVVSFPSRQESDLLISSNQKFDWNSAKFGSPGKLGLPQQRCGGRSLKLTKLSGPEGGSE